MTEKTLLICGGFNTEERARLSGAHPSHVVASPAAIADMAKTDQAAICAVAYKGHHAFDGATMDLLPSLGVVSNYGVGYDSIDVEAATTRNVKVTNTPNVLNDDVADLTVGMMLSFARNMEAGSKLVRSGAWARGSVMPLARKMSGDTVGIVGLGRIGRDIADRLAVFKMDIHYHSRSEKETPGWTYHADVVEMAAVVNWLVVVLVGGPATQNYIDTKALKALGPRGVLVNISRGTTVNEAALLDALEKRTIAGAALDVFMNEPKADPRFYELENVVLQPHQGSATVETRRAMAELQLQNVTNFLTGAALLTPVN